NYMLVAVFVLFFCLCFFFFECYRAHGHLHSFPTRRSSDLEFRRAIAENYAREFGVPVSPEHVMVGSGAKPFEQFFCEAFLDPGRSEEHTSELQSLAYLVCRPPLEKKKSYLLLGLRFCPDGY